MMVLICRKPSKLSTTSNLSFEKKRHSCCDFAKADRAAAEADSEKDVLSDGSRCCDRRGECKHAFVDGGAEHEKVISGYSGPHKSFLLCGSRSAQPPKRPIFGGVIVPKPQP